MRQNFIFVVVNSIFSLPKSDFVSKVIKSCFFRLEYSDFLLCLNWLKKQLFSSHPDTSNHSGNFFIILQNVWFDSRNPKKFVSVIKLYMSSNWRVESINDVWMVPYHNRWKSKENNSNFKKWIPYSRNYKTLLNRRPSWL